MGHGSEGSTYSASDVLERNKPYIKTEQKSYQTDLGKQESIFRKWVSTNKVPFDPNDPRADYDMRGYWQALQKNDPVAKQSIDPNSGQMHFPDQWKTPYDLTFSAQSQYANPRTAPDWNEQDQLVTPNGQTIYDDKKEVMLQLLHNILQHPAMQKLLHEQAMRHVR